jgi:hypothetical protein
MLDGATIFMIIRVLVIAFLLWLFYRRVRTFIARIRSDRALAPKIAGQFLLQLFTNIHYRVQSLLAGLPLIFASARKRLLTSAIAACILLLLVSCYPTFQQLEEQNLSTLYQIAETVGYTPDALIVQDRSCWDPSLYPPYTNECAIFLIFSTDATVPEVQTMIENLNYRELYNQSTHITRLATLINRSSPKMLYLDGADALNNENDAKLWEFSAHYWNLRDAQDRPVGITLFLTANTDNRFAIDDMPVEQNLLLVQLFLGRVYP